MFYHCCHTFFLLLIAQENNYQYDHNNYDIRLRSSQDNKLRPHKLYFPCVSCVAKKLGKLL